MIRFFKKIPWILAMTLILGMLASCGTQQAQEPAEEETANTPVVYYLSDDNTKLLERACPLESEGDQVIADLFQVLSAGDFPDGHSAIPSGVALDHMAWQEDCLVLYLTGEYPKAGTAEDTLCRNVLVQTLLPPASVSSLQIFVNDAPLMNADGSEAGALTADQFLGQVDNAGSENRRVSLRLYFASADGSSLEPCLVQTEVPIDKTLEDAVMERLIAGPGGDNLLATLSSQTSVLSTSVKNRICYVNVSDEFLTQIPGIASKLTVYSVVNSLAELAEVEQVQITVEGSADVTLAEEISLAKPLRADETLITVPAHTGAYSEGVPNRQQIETTADAG